MLFTIGHSVYKFDFFLSLLEKHKINYLIDVRSSPFSRFAQDFNKGILANSLKETNIKYVLMGDYFGARPKDRELYSKEGYLDFEKVWATEQFKKGLNNIIKGLKQNNNICLMCTEKDPIDCHRAIMISRAFNLKGIEVNHILQSGEIQTQKELDERLLDLYFPDRGQLSLFSEDNLTDEQMLVEAYRMRNKKIGYEMEKEQEI